MNMYNFDEKDGFEAIETHYFNDGYDVASLMDDGDVYVILADGEFSEDWINNVEDVFVGDSTTFIVASIENADDTLELIVFEMSTAEFEARWSESICSKFRGE